MFLAIGASYVGVRTKDATKTVFCLNHFAAKTAFIKYLAISGGHLHILIFTTLWAC